jgi:MFS transporter, SET family, sugar efflux transporter
MSNDKPSPQLGPLSGPQSILRAAALFARERDLRALVACAVAQGLAGSFVMPYLSLFGTREVGMSVPAFGAFMTLSVVSNILIGNVLARRSDQMTSRRPVLLLGSAAGALGYLGYAFVRNAWGLVPIGTLVLGVASLTFSQLFAQARETLGRANIEPAEAPLYMNAFRMTYALSWTVGPALAAFTLREASFRGLFLVAALLQVAFFGVVFRFVRAGGSETVASASATALIDRPGSSDAAAAPAAAPQKAKPLWRDPGILPWFFALIMAFAAQSISMGNMSLYVIEDLGGTERHVGIIFSLAPLFELPFMLYFGLLATRVAAERMIRAGFWIALVYYGALVFARTPWHVYPLQILSAAMVAVTSGIAITFFQDKLPKQLGAATNLYVNAIRLGSTSGYLLFGSVAAQFGHRGAYVACVVLAALALAFVAAHPRVLAFGSARVPSQAPSSRATRAPGGRGRGAE